MSGQYADSALYPGLRKLPGPVQLLILCEREEEMLLIQEKHDPHDFDKEAICDCFFWQQYQLSCRHLFQVNSLTRQLICKEHWEEVWHLIMLTFYYTKNSNIACVLNTRD